MVAQFVRLKLTLLANTFRRSVWQTIGVCLGSLYAAGVVLLAITAAVAGGAANAVVTGQVLVIAGSVVVLAWLLVPVFLYGVDATLDPHRFVTYPIPRRQLLTGLAAAGVISVPGLATLLAFTGTALAWWRTPLVVVAALIGAALAVALCVVGSRAVTSLLAPLLESRRSREVLTIVAFVPIVLIGPGVSWFSQQAFGAPGDAAVERAIGGAAGFLGWTPLGAPWGLAASVHDGAWLSTLGRLVVAVVSLALLALVWDRALTRSLERPAAGGGKGARAKGLGMFDRFPATPVGAVAARTATYWLRDPRYSGSLVVIPLLPVVLALASRGAEHGGVGGVVLILAPLTAWMLGFSISNDIAYDHTAFALHVATGVEGRADRWGRVVPVLVVGAPLTVVYAVLSVAISGHWQWLQPILGLSLGALAASAGVSSAVSAHWLFPVAKPGESPFKQPQGAAGATMLAQAVGMGLALVVSAPAIALTLLAILLPSLVLGWVTLVLAPALGVVVLIAGVRWGARRYDQRAPELLQRVLSYA